MQNFAPLPILSTLILFTVFATESIGYAKMSVGRHISIVCKKQNSSRCRMKGNNKFLLENCAEEMNNVRITTSCSSFKAVRRSVGLNITSTQIWTFKGSVDHKVRCRYVFVEEFYHEKTNSLLKHHNLGSRGQKLSRQQNVISRQLIN